MEECAYCLNNLSPMSLVIIDELGRGTPATPVVSGPLLDALIEMHVSQLSTPAGTSTSDGVGIAYAMCERLIQSTVRA